MDCEYCNKVYKTQNRLIKHVKNKHDKRVVRYIDLFCGLGAFHVAFDKLNKSQDKTKYMCVFASDINDDVRKIYQENYNIKPFGDINLVDMDKIPEFDILCAGFPCQPFSIAGKKEAFKDKTKGNLFFNILEIIDKKKPSTIILENVKNLHTINNGKTFKKIKNELQKRKYTFNYKIIDSRHYGSPQSRSRIFIICHVKNTYIFKDINKNIVPVSTIIDDKITTFFDYEKKYKLEKCNGKRIKFKLINKITNKGGRQGERVYSIHSYGPTICASSGGPGGKTGFYEINGKIRTLSINETLKMFGFNETYKYNTLKNKKKMLFFLGNSIVVNVLNELLKGIDKL